MKFLDGKNVFHRCEYDRTTPKNGVERKTYVIRDYAPGWECVDAFLDNHRYLADAPGAPESCVVREVNKRMKGEIFEPVSLEVFVNGECVLKFDNFGIDMNEYTAEELLANPELLPDQDIEGFKRAYAEYLEEVA